MLIKICIKFKKNKIAYELGLKFKVYTLYKVFDNVHNAQKKKTYQEHINLSFFMS